MLPDPGVRCPPIHTKTKLEIKPGAQKLASQSRVTETTDVLFGCRQYCARRIRRIRKSLHFLQGTRHKVQPKKVTEEAILKDAR